jgi:ribonuclease BN (tRNA processing enzyme)
MKLRVLGCHGGSTPARHLPGLLLDDTGLLEAGSVTSALPLDEQAEIRHVLLSHAHLDHTGGLAYLADNRCCHRSSTGNGYPLTVSSVEPVVRDLREHLFNGRIWPDFSGLPSTRDPIVRFRTLSPGVAQRIDDRLTVMPIRVHHTVPTVGFIVHDEAGALVFSGDTGPTEELWNAARDLGGARAVIVETSFPNRLDALAEVSTSTTTSRPSTTATASR